MAQQVDPNTEQSEQWNGDEGRSWVTYHDKHDQMVGALTPYLLRAAGIEDNDRVLDVGCGCGETTCLAAARAASGHVVGIDLSAPMIEAARDRVRQGDFGERVTFLHADAQSHRFEGDAFDVVLSRFGVMFFADPAKAFANVARAIRPGGRLAFLCWQVPLANEWIVTPGAALATYLPLPNLGGDDGPGPFSLAEPDRVRSLLADAGFSGIRIEPVLEAVVLTQGGRRYQGHPEACAFIGSGTRRSPPRHLSVALAVCSSWSD